MSEKGQIRARPAQGYFGQEPKRPFIRLSLNTVYSGLMYFSAAVFFGISGLCHHVEFVGYNWTTWFAIGGLIIMPTFLGHSLFSHLMKRMNLNLMTCGKLIEPVISALTAYILFNQIPVNETYLAFILTSLSVMILFFPRLRRANP